VGAAALHPHQSRLLFSGVGYDRQLKEKMELSFAGNLIFLSEKKMTFCN